MSAEGLHPLNDRYRPILMGTTSRHFYLTSLGATVARPSSGLTAGVALKRKR